MDFYFSQRKKQFFYYFLLFSISSLSFGQSAEKTLAEAVAQAGSAKNFIWVIGSAGNDSTNDASKNGTRADVTVGATGTYATLNAAIRDALAANHNKIYIQEGLYYVNSPIILEGRFGGYLPSYNDPLAGYFNQISIEGEGVGTRIMAASGYNGPLISVRSEYNTIRNLSLLIEQNESKVGLEIRKDNTAWSSTVSTIYPGDQRYNIFENLYIGKKARIKGSPDNIELAATAGVYGIVLENSNYSNTAIVYNKFKNITIHGVESAILFKKSTPTAIIWSQDNTFENFDINQAARAIDLFQPQTVGGVTYYQPVLMRNTFRRFTFQTATFSNNVVNNLYGDNNVFDDFKLADWASQNIGIANRRVFVLTKDAKFTTISNSTVGGSGEVHGEVNDITDSFDPATNLVSNPVVNTYTQLINNNRAGVGISKLGFNGFKDSSGNNKSLTKIEGRLQIAGQSGGANTATTPTAATGKVLTATDDLGNAIWKPLATNTPAAGLVLTATDNLGNATWQTVASNAAWSHIATKNINMNSFALTNNSNAVPATNTDPGLRLDNSGNVRIGTTAPVATGEKLQVDGAAKVETLTATGIIANIGTPVQFASYPEALAKSLVINAGSLSGNSERTLQLYDFPKSNYFPNSALQFTLADRNNKKRFDFNAGEYSTTLRIGDYADGYERFNFIAGNSYTALNIGSYKKKVLFNIIENTNDTDLKVYDEKGYTRLYYNVRKTGQWAGASGLFLNDPTGRTILRFAEQNLGDGSNFSHFSLTQPVTIMTIGSTWDNLTYHLQNDFKLVLKNGSSAYYNRPGSLFAESNVIAMGKIGIGTETFSYQETTGTIDYSLAVKGNVRAYMYKAITTDWSDFVFKKDYKLPSLAAVEKHIEANGHLPNMPSEKEIVKDGIDLGEMAKLQMQKIEELTLYLIEQNKKIESMAKEIKELKERKK